MIVTQIENNKNTLWVFGESHSALIKSNIHWCKNYIDWKGYEPKTFGEIISEKLNFNLENLAIHGCDNYTIFETFCKNIQNIKKGDWLIFGWSSLCRFRVGKENQTWESIAPMDVDEQKLKNLKYITQNTLDSISLNRSNVQALLVNEIEIWINLIKTILSECTLIFYSPSLDDFINTNGLEIGVKKFDVERIMDETNGIIMDGHYSEKGHSDLAKLLYQQYTK